MSWMQVIAAPPTVEMSATHVWAQAMENSIGNVAQQMFSSFGKQPGTSLQQTNAATTAATDIPVPNQFVQVGNLLHLKPNIHKS